MVLLVVDVQNALINEHPYNERNVIGNIKKLISAARNTNTEVIYVRHNDEQGSDFEKGTKSWQIYSDVAPNEDEHVVEKEYNSAFHKTELRIYLESKKIDTIVLTGLQVEYCMDATLKSAFDYGDKIIIPEETNTTFDNEFLSGEKLYEFYNYKIWNKRFANVLSMEDVLQTILV